MAKSTCRTCPYYTEPDGGVRRFLPPRAGFDVDSPKALPRVDGDEDWCGQHPERQPRVCLECLDLGYLHYEVTDETGYSRAVAKHCPACHGTGKVVSRG